jgi:hypothetical protein
VNLAAMDEWEYGIAHGNWWLWQEKQDRFPNNHLNCQVLSGVSAGWVGLGQLAPFSV